MSFYIFENSLILTIQPLNTTVHQLKNQSHRINLNRQILTLGHFLLHTSRFSTSRTSRIVYCKKPLKIRSLLQCILGESN
jgi:hypothetical protein